MGVYSINGLLNVLKPPGMTSFDTVAYLRRILKEKKIGHAGTLDPDAAGVLPICTGKATKVIEYIMDMEKVYRAELILGVSTDTQDSSGNVIAVNEVTASEQQIISAIKSFMGEIYQTPPMYSAIRLEGRRLYELAREGKSVERKPRRVEIHSIDVIKIDKEKVLFDVTCSKGTYIRTLCLDIGDRLGCGGHMSFLIRKRTGIFDIGSALTLEEILKANNDGKICGMFLKVDEVFKEYKSFHLNEHSEKLFKNGGFIYINNINIINKTNNENIIDEISNVNIIDKNHYDFSSGLLVRVYNEKKDFLALGQVIVTNGSCYLKPKKMFV
ncbi:MAG TPA: tRNA pseudouridine(55) synthase TruB [Clostridiales bacterium]|nr:tRNA pseudouridine(55) synthase TruB [Clostridiales bacterium]